ncbi:MAG: hypothetical protein JXA15_04895 [Spirochaetales bacterium]|nr:hypothetical protein [Spirochaetales bacterium]
MMLDRTLRVVLAIAVVALVAGTVFALFSGTPRATLERRATEDAAASRLDERPRGVFFDLGGVRATTRDDDGTLVLATIAIAYDDSDAAILEELEDKRARLRDAAASYFASKSRDELSPAFEGLVKAELRERFDAMLSLGSVDEIWLPAFAIID